MPNSLAMPSSGRTSTFPVPRDFDALISRFGFGDWPNEEVQFDPGGRHLSFSVRPDITVPNWLSATHGLDDCSRETRSTLAASSLRLSGIYREFRPRLASFAERHLVTHVMGCHIETTAQLSVDYAVGATDQPVEPPLRMSVDQH